MSIMLRKTLCLNRNHISAVFIKMTTRRVFLGRSTFEPIPITINYCIIWAENTTKAGKIFSHNIIQIYPMKTEPPILRTPIPIFKIIICTANKTTISTQSIRIWTKWAIAISLIRTTRTKRTSINRIVFKTKRTISKSHATNIKITITNTSPITIPWTTTSRSRQFRLLIPLTSTSSWPILPSN